jgi:hypothetical protein
MNESGPPTAEAQGTLRTNLSIHHVLGAARFSRQVAEIERTHAAKPFGEFFDEILDVPLRRSSLNFST